MTQYQILVKDGTERQTYIVGGADPENARQNFVKLYELANPKKRLPRILKTVELFAEVE